ncbi:hypothetical protein ACI65C_000802 [Semiaphis heraclei]
MDRLEQNIKNMSGTPNINNNPIDSTFLAMFPLKSIDSLKDFDTRITNDPDFKLNVLKKRKPLHHMSKRNFKRYHEADKKAACLNLTFPSSPPKESTTYCEYVEVLQDKDLTNVCIPSNTQTIQTTMYPSLPLTSLIGQMNYLQT